MVTTQTSTMKQTNLPLQEHTTAPSGKERSSEEKEAVDTHTPHHTHSSHLHPGWKVRKTAGRREESGGRASSRIQTRSSL